MNESIEAYRMADGSLPAYSWPGMYPMYYATRDGLVVCAKCANRDDSDLVGADANWENAHLYCDDCGTRIESAYAEED